ncbi:Putative disease resistance protein At3g14460 [Linum grandiflorum]
MIYPDSTQSLTIDSSHLFFMEDLRCLIANGLEDMEPDAWGHFSGIRSLVFLHSELKKIPPTINHLIHMRHLDLSGNEKLEELPEEICELYNLWALIINLCRNLKRMSVEMGNKLVNLEHFENVGVLAPVPKSIRRLTRLKILTRFIVDKDQQERGASVADLKDMNQLQGSLLVYGPSNVAEVEEADFPQKTGLTSLGLVFGKINDEELLEAVRPSTNVEDLYIGGYMGASIWPSWMASLSNLTHLAFHRCDEVNYLPPLGSLPSLEALSFTGMMKVNKVGVELLGQQHDDIGSAFPRLSLLKLDCMSEWQEWDDAMLSSPSVMPCLSSLNLRSCNQLKKLPDAILQKPTLKRLVVLCCDSLQGSGFHWEESYSKYSSPEIVLSEVWDKISHIPTIIIDFFDVRTGRVHTNAW